MENFKEWFSFQLLSKSLLSARPFSFFYEESPDGRLGNQDSTLSNMSSTSPTTHSSEIRDTVPASAQPVEAEMSDIIQYTKVDQNTDLLSRIEALQISFLRLIQRIGQSSANPVVSQVLYRLQLASLIRAGETNVKKPSLKLDRARTLASKLESSGQSDLDFCFKILILGKTGVGKSATINSIFDQLSVPTYVIGPGTDQVQEVTGMVNGIRISVIDTPGLLPAHYSSCRRNRKILFQVKRYIKRSPPDIVLYLDRLDVINRGNNDYKLLKLITEVFGPSIWCNAIIGMTHSSSIPPEGPDGFSISYELFVNQRTNLVQRYIHQAIQNTQLENPVILVENHPMCRRNPKGEKILPNGQVWMSQLLLLCTATKVLGDANSFLGFQDSFQFTKTRTILPSVPHILSLLLQPSWDPSEDESNTIFDEADDEYDRLPPICILTRAQYDKLSKEHRKAYLDELHYREILYLKKQWNDELKRLKEKKKSNDGDNEDGDSQELVQLQDIPVPLSFEPDLPSYRYRCLISSNNQWLIRPVSDLRGWDHEVGFDGISLETSQEFEPNLKSSLTGQLIKNKEESHIQSEFQTKYADPEGRSLLTGIDIQSVQKTLVCTLRGDAKFENFGCNSTGGGLTLTSFGKVYFVGAKVEDSLSIGRRLKLNLNAGKVMGHGQEANGGSLEAVLRGKDYPVRDDKLLKLVANVLSFENEMVLRGTLESDFCISRSEKISVSANLNSRQLGKVCLKINSSEHIQIALIAVISIFRALFRGCRNSDSVQGETP